MGDPRDVRPCVEELVALADVVKASAEDLAWLYPSLPVPDVLADWLGRGPALVAVTLGPDGVLAGCRRSQLRGIKADALADVLSEALTVAAITCTRRGADPPTAAEVAGAQL